VRYRYRDTMYRISVQQISAAEEGFSLLVDGVTQGGFTIPLRDDHTHHSIEIRVPTSTDVDKA
jgi:hypothetical protein